MPDPGPTALETAVDEQGKAAASAAAAGLLEAAVKASAVQAHDVDGSSKMAYNRAMTVLGTEALIEAERVKAAAAAAAIEGIDTSDMSAAQMTRIAGILEAAETSLAEIVAILKAEADDEGSLAKAVMDIKTGTAVGADDSEVAQAKAKAVSDAIMAAIAIEDTPALPDSAGPSDAPEGAVMHAGMSGMTFAEINGGSPRMAAMKVGDFSSDLAGDTALAALTTGTLGGTTAAYYKGIQGSLVCLSAACGVEDGNITGTVEFVPTSPSELYVQASVGSDYSRASNAASYGYWLNDMDQISSVLSQ